MVKVKKLVVFEDREIASRSATFEEFVLELRKLKSKNCQHWACLNAWIIFASLKFSSYQ